MAVVANPLIGHTKQSVGNTTFSVWKGLNVLKTKASPHNPKTPSQIAQRAAFSQAVFIFRRCLPAIDQGFVEHKTHQSQFNASVHYNLGTSIVRNLIPPYTPTVNLPQLLVSKGSILGVQSGSVTNVNIGSFTVGWTNNTDNLLGLATDVVRVVIVHAITFVPYEILQNAPRSAGSVTQPLPPVWAGQPVHVYAFFSRIPGLGTIPTKSSDTAWLGSYTLI